MALPTLTKTWQFNNNNALASFGSAALDNKNLYLQIKNALLAFGSTPATMFYSCNSVTAGTAGDGIDRITTVANLVNAAPGSAHSWFVLKFPGINTNYQFLFDLNTTAAAVNTGAISVSASAGFTGGSTTAAPTATDSILINANVITSLTTDLAQRWTVQQSTDGQVIIIAVYAATVPRIFAVFQKGANPTTGTPGATNSGWSHWGTAATDALGGLTLQNAITATTVLSYESTAQLAIASEVDGLWDLFPIGQACTATVGARGRLFTLQDMWVASPSLAIGDTAPTSGTLAQFVCVQANASQTIWIPWNNGAFNLS